MSDHARHIHERYSNRKHIIDRLIKEDPVFFSLCDEYDVCVEAFRYWSASEKPEAKSRIREYGALIQELEKEIEQALQPLA